MIPSWLIVIIAVLAGCTAFLVRERFVAEKKLDFLLGELIKLRKHSTAIGQSAAEQLSIHADVFKKHGLAETFEMGPHTVVAPDDMPKEIQQFLSVIGRKPPENGGSPADLLSKILADTESTSTQDDKQSSSRSGKKE